MDRTQIILVGNIITLIGSIIMICTGLIKKKTHTLIAQSIMFAVMAVGNLVLGGFTGCVSNIVSIIRNIWNIKFKYTWPVKIVFIIIQIAISVRVNNLGLLGYLPVAAACAFTWFLDVKSDFGIKVLIVSTQIPWLIYDISISNYTASFFDVLTVITSTITMVRLKRTVSANESDKVQEI